MRSTILRFRLVLGALALACAPLVARGDDAEPEKKPAVLIVRLPADAELYVAGIKSTQTGASREFASPPLAPGKKFSYQVKAVWRKDGKEIVRLEKAIVRTGETTQVDLLTEVPLLLPPIDNLPPAKKPEPEKKPEPQKKPEPEKKPTPASAPSGKLGLVLPEALKLRAGSIKILPIKVVRTNLDGPVAVTFEGLPPGVVLKDATVAAGKERVYLSAVAATDAEERECEARVVGVCGNVRQAVSLKIKLSK
jgi:uncharacterized protein (TIGR03000 family)